MDLEYAAIQVKDQLDRYPSFAKGVREISFMPLERSFPGTSIPPMKGFQVKVYHTDDKPWKMFIFEDNSGGSFAYGYSTGK